jgi:hypothetical protein
MPEPHKDIYFIFILLNFGVDYMCLGLLVFLFALRIIFIIQ